MRAVMIVKEAMTEFDEQAELRVTGTDAGREPDPTAPSIAERLEPGPRTALVDTVDTNTIDNDCLGRLHRLILYLSNP